MNILASYSLLCFLLLLVTLKCSGQRYYRQERIQGARLCENDRTFMAFITQTMNKYDIKLDGYEQSVIIEKRFNASQVKRIKSDCKFTIDTKLFSRNSGIYINILKMRLRKIKLTGACIDSITVKYNDKNKKRFCGNLETGDIKSIEDNEGRVKITVSIDRGVPFNDPDDFVEFQIVATAFKDCHDLEQEFMCKKNTKRSCISSVFVNDTLVNCNQPECSDEKLGCQASSAITTNYEMPQTANNVTQIFLSAITSLLLTMFGCGGCVYCFFRIKRCICPSQSPQTTTRIHRRRRRNNQNDSEVPSSSPDLTPSAPPADKDDLPPSYSVLFPERVKEEATTT